MVKRRKAVYVIGSVLIGIVTILVVFLALVGTGVIETQSSDLVFTSASAQREYDGEEFTCEEWTLTKGKLKDGHTARVTVSGAQLEVGTSVNNIEVTIVDEQGADVGEKYNIECIPGTLTVTSRYYEIKSDNAVKEYDGTPLKCEAYTVVEGDLPKSHKLNVAYSGEITDAGTAENTFTARIRDARNRDVTSNYELVCSTGQLRVTKRALGLQSSSAEKTYDGTPLTADKCTIAVGSLCRNHDIKYTVTGSTTAVDKAENSFTAAVFDSEGRDVSANYEIDYTFGTLSVLKRPLTVSTNSAEKTYDGTALTAGGYEVVEGSLADGQTLDVTVTGSQTNAGSSDNTFTAYILDSDGNRAEANYDITPVRGTLSVLKRPLTVSTNSAEKTYDATPLTEGGYEIAEGSLADGQTLDVTVTGSLTNAGTSDNTFTASIIDSDGNSAEANYDITPIRGTLKVTPAPVTIETDSDYKVYDGTALIADRWRVVLDRATGEFRASGVATALCGDDEITVNLYGSQKAAGSSFNGYVLVGISNNGTDVSGNYVVTDSIGTLTVGKRPLAVQSASDSKTYDGNALTNAEWVLVSNTELAEGEEIIVAVSGTRTEVGESPNTIAEVKILSDTDDVTVNYDITLDEGVLVVKGKNGTTLVDPEPSDEKYVVMRLHSDRSGSVYLRSASYGDYAGNGFYAADEYGELLDGKYGYNYLPTFALRGESASASITVDRAGQYGIAPFVLPYYPEINDETLQTSDVQYVGPAYYSLNFYPYVYTADNGAALPKGTGSGYTAEELAYRDYVYANYLAVPDSTRDFMAGIIAAQGFDRSNADVIASVASYIQNAATYNLEYDRAMENEEDIAVAFLRDYREGVCRHYAAAATLMFRTLGIPARYVTGFLGTTVENTWVDVTSDRGHAWVETYIDGAGWVFVEVTGGDGSSAGEGQPSDNPSTGYLGDVFRIKPLDCDKKYDGKELRPGRSVQGLSELTAKGYTYEAVISGSRTEVGYGVSTIDEFVLRAPGGAVVLYKNGDKIDNYDEENLKVTFADGRLHVYEFEISVKTESASKTYDGNVLECGEWSFTGGALAAGHSIATLSMGKITDVGTVANSFNPVIADGAGNDATHRYKINVDEGSLTVNPIEITLRTRSATATLSELNGGALTAGYDVLDGEGHTIADFEEFSGGCTLFVKLGGSQSKVGRSDNYVSSVEITVGSNDVTRNFRIAYDIGKLTVTRG